jgi:hypothetical protein
METRIWSRWKRFAQRAGEVQANALFFLLYFIVLVPLAWASPRNPLFRRGAVRRQVPSWRARTAANPDLPGVRRQF